MHTSFSGKRCLSFDTVRASGNVPDKLCIIFEPDTTFTSILARHGFSIAQNDNKTCLPMCPDVCSTKQEKRTNLEALRLSTQVERKDLELVAQYEEVGFRDGFKHVCSA